MDPKTVVWRFCDGKAGHERQSAGLLRALETLRPLDVHTVRRGESLPRARPQLAVGAGSACAWRMVLTPSLRGAYRVYLMKPPCPAWLFDLCLVPRHDGLAEGSGIVVTDGVLNDLIPSAGPRSGPALVLVGGPSRHHGWDEQALLAQVASVLDGTSETPVVVSDSRRTPASTTQALRRFASARVSVVHHAEVGPGWLPTALPRAPVAWVSADSVSMLFEALTAGCAVGVLDVPARRDDRVSGIAPSLLARGLAGSLTDWRRTGHLAPPREPVAEAVRCAVLIDRALAARGARC